VGGLLGVTGTKTRTDRSERSSGCPATTKDDQPDPIYQALWADTIDFNEVLISPVMVHDHMPDTVLSAINKVLYTVTVRKWKLRSPKKGEKGISADLEFFFRIFSYYYYYLAFLVE
jgi:hypothetical protein